MLTEERTLSDHPETDHTDQPSADDDLQRVGTLRGAGVAPVNVRRLGQGLVALCLVTLLVLSIVTFVAGAHRNDQINSLKQHGVPVTVTVTSCLGLLGGSGSNGAGYTCKGSFTQDGNRYVENIPGNVQYATGTQLHAVVVPGDPALLTLSRTLATEQASGSVYALPSVLLALSIIGAVLLGLWIRADRRRTSAPA